MMWLRHIFFFSTGKMMGIAKGKVKVKFEVPFSTYVLINKNVECILNSN